MRIDFPRAPRQHRERKTSLVDIAKELKLISWQGRILVSCAVPRRVEFHVCRTCTYEFPFFFGMEDENDSSILSLSLDGCKEGIFKVLFFFNE